MARGAVKAKQQARAKAQPQPRPLKRGGRRRGSGGGNPNQDLFFMKLRRHAKWAYVGLAVLFAVTFAGLGVGSGSSGLDQLFNGLNIFGGNSGTSVSKALKEIDAHPSSGKGYRDLATAYEAKGDTSGAVTALQSLTSLQKKNADAFAELGGLELTLAQGYVTQYQDAAAVQAQAAPSQPFLPSGTLGTALGTNPIEQAAAQKASTATNDLYQKAVLAYQEAVTAYQTVAKLHPHDANAQFQVATAAQSAGQYAVAVTALKKYLQLNPQATQRAQIEKLIKQLSPAPAKPAKKKSSSTGK
jgi:tetratricopeptide (TPR) repeat protein